MHIFSEEILARVVAEVDACREDEAWRSREVLSNLASLGRVNKVFHRLVKPVLYENIAIGAEGEAMPANRAHLFLRSILEDGDLAMAVKNLCINHWDVRESLPWDTLQLAWPRGKHGHASNNGEDGPALTYEEVRNHLQEPDDGSRQVDDLVVLLLLARCLNIGRLYLLSSSGRGMRFSHVWRFAEFWNSQGTNATTLVRAFPLPRLQVLVTTFDGDNVSLHDMWPLLLRSSYLRYWRGGMGGFEAGVSLEGTSRLEFVNLDIRHQNADPGLLMQASPVLHHLTLECYPFWSSEVIGKGIGAHGHSLTYLKIALFATGGDQDTSHIGAGIAKLSKLRFLSIPRRVLLDGGKPTNEVIPTSLETLIVSPCNDAPSTPRCDLAVRELLGSATHSIKGITLIHGNKPNIRATHECAHELSQQELVGTEWTARPMFVVNIINDKGETLASADDAIVVMEKAGFSVDQGEVMGAFVAINH